MMTRFSRTPADLTPSLSRCLVLLLLLFTLAGGIAAVTPGTAHAAAEVTRTTPPDGELLQRWPRAVVVSFSEPLDPETSTLRLVDLAGSDIEGTRITFGPDGATISLEAPTGLPNGTYSVIWEAHSAVDGEVTPGYSSFTVGTAADGSVVTIPSTGGHPGGPPQWLESLARWTALLGLAALVAVWPVWTLIIRPSLSPVWRHAAGIVPLVTRFTAAAVTLALLGSIFQVVVHSRTLIGGSAFDKIMNTIGQTTWGHIWIARIALIILLGVLLAIAGWWFVRKRPIERALAWVFTIALPLPFSLVAHAADEPTGRAAAVAADYLHLLAATMWGGGILLLTAVLLPSLRGVSGDARRQVLTTALFRFSILTVLTWIVMALSGSYAAWLQVGNIHALTSTDYGRALMVKLAVALLSAVIIAVNLLVIRRRIERNRETQSATIWSRRLGWTLGVQAVLVAVIFAATAQMTGVPPARDVVLEEANQVSIPVSLAGRPSTLLIAPGTTGVNHIRLEVPGAWLPNDTLVMLRVALPERAELGAKEFQLSRVSGNNFEHHGTEFSLSGDWHIGISLTEPGLPPLSSEVTHTFGAEAPKQDLPGIPWRFDPMGGVGAVVLLFIGIGGVITAAYAGRTPLRKEAGGLGLAALALGVVILLQARYDPILAVGGEQGQINQNDLAMVERGELVYTDACLSCHGPELRGDGPQADTMDPPPADFAAPHTFVHSDEDNVYWVKNGKQGTGMPGFDGTLSDQEIRDVLAYIKNRQQDLGDGGNVPEPQACIVREMSFAELTGTFNHAIHPETLRGTPLVEAVDPSVDGDTQNDLLFTIEQLVACTNAGDTMRRLPLFTSEQIMDMFPMGMDGRLVDLTTTGAHPVPESDRVGLQDVQAIRQLADGRIAATVVFADPAGIGIGLGAENSVLTQATLVFIRDEAAGAWLIDEIR